MSTLYLEDSVEQMTLIKLHKLKILNFIDFRITTDLQTWLEESHFIYKNIENQTVEVKEAWRRISLVVFIPIEQQLKAPGCLYQDVGW